MNVFWALAIYYSLTIFLWFITEALFWLIRKGVGLLRWAFLLESFYSVLIAFLGKGEVFLERKKKLKYKHIIQLR